MSDGNTTFEAEIEKYGHLVYTNKGTSMLPLLREGKDLFVIARKPEGRLKKYDVPLYKRGNGEYVLHRVLKVRKDGYVLCGDHCWGLETGVTDSQVIGVLEAVVRDGKTIPVTDRRYRLYVHLWCDFFPIRAAILWLKTLPESIIGKVKG